MKREYKIIDGKFYDENGKLVDDPYEDYKTKKDFRLVIEDGIKMEKLIEKMVLHVKVKGMMVIKYGF